MFCILCLSYITSEERSSCFLKAWYIIMFLSSRVIVLFPEIQRGEGEGVCVCMYVCNHMTHFRATPPDAITHSIRLRSACVCSGTYVCGRLPRFARSSLSLIFYTSEEHPVMLENARCWIGFASQIVCQFERLVSCLFYSVE